jgi:hypothetical protein
MPISDRDHRRRLRATLKKLNDISLASLARDDLHSQTGPDLSFRKGLPYFEKTIELFRTLARSNLKRVPSEYLRIVADHADRALAQFEEILNFTGEGIDDPDQVRNHLIGEVRDYYRVIHDDIGLIVTRSGSQHEKIPKPPWYAGTPLAMILLLMVVVAFGFAYHYTNISYWAQSLMQTMHEIAHQQ